VPGRSIDQQAGGSMRALVIRILDTGRAAGDDPDLVVRKRTAVATALVAGSASLAYIPGTYPFVRREGVEVKGKGVLTTWILDPRTVREPPFDR
jgi:hypothetical protein